MNLNEIKYWLYFKWTDLKFWYQCLTPREQGIFIIVVLQIILTLLAIAIVLNCNYYPNSLICWHN